MKLLFVLALLFLCISSFKIKKNIVETVPIDLYGIYPDGKLLMSDKIYVRGVSCGLTWSDGQSLTRVGSNTWKITLNCSKNTTNIVKLLLNDKTWMIGSNYRF
jgi:hypothetical protein